MSETYEAEFCLSEDLQNMNAWIPHCPTVPSRRSLETFPVPLLGFDVIKGEAEDEEEAPVGGG